VSSAGALAFTCALRLGEPRRLAAALAPAAPSEDTPRLLSEICTCARSGRCALAHAKLFTGKPSEARRAPARGESSGASTRGAGRRCSYEMVGKEDALARLTAKILAVQRRNKNAAPKESAAFLSGGPILPLRGVAWCDAASRISCDLSARRRLPRLAQVRLEPWVLRAVACKRTACPRNSGRSLPRP